MLISVRGRPSDWHTVVGSISFVTDNWSQGFHTPCGSLGAAGTARALPTSKLLFIGGFREGEGGGGRGGGGRAAGVQQLGGGFSIAYKSHK